METAPPLELHVASGVVTLVRFESSLRLIAWTLPEGESRVRLMSLEEGAFIVVPSPELPPEARVPLSVDTGSGSLRFVLVHQREEVDLRVRVVPAPEVAGEDAAEAVARELLATAEGRASLVLPQSGVEHHVRNSWARVDSVVWMGRRFFATLSVRTPQRSVRPWSLVQVRLRVTLPEGDLLEWSARFLSGPDGRWRRYHVFTGLVPVESSRLEVALDGEESPGVFQVLCSDEVPARP